MEPNPQNIVNQPLPPVVPNKNLNILLIIIVGIVMLLLGLGGGYLLFANKSYVNQLDTTQILPTEIPQVNPTSSESLTTDSTANWKTYTNTKYNFSFKYPETWSDGGSGGDPTLETAISNENKGAPLEGTNKHVFLMVQVKPETVLTQCFPTNLAKTDLISTSDVIMGGSPAKEYLVDSSHPGGESAYATIYGTTSQNNCYILEFLSLAKETRDSNVNTANQVLSTFKFTQ